MIFVPAMGLTNIAHSQSIPINWQEALSPDGFSVSDPIGNDYVVFLNATVASGTTSTNFSTGGLLSLVQGAATFEITLQDSAGGPARADFSSSFTNTNGPTEFARDFTIAPTFTDLHPNHSWDGTTFAGRVGASITDTSDFDITIPGEWGFYFEISGGGNVGPFTLDALTLESIPEPSSATLLGLSALGLLIRRKR